MNESTVVRSLHDIGLASWFGGSLMGAVGLNGAASDHQDTTKRTTTAADGWARWAPVAAVSIGAHVVGGAGLLFANRNRVKRQAGVGKNTAVKLAVTGLAMGTTAYSGVLGAKLAKAGEVPSDGPTSPSSATPTGIASIQRQMKYLAWATPMLTGALVVLSADQGERQRPISQLHGFVNSIKGNLPNPSDLKDSLPSVTSLKDALHGIG